MDKTKIDWCDSTIKKEKQIEEISQILINAIGRESVDRFIENEQGDLVGVATVSLYQLAEELYNAGYRKVEENKE